jgi:hypothetical protein
LHGPGGLLTNFSPEGMILSAQRAARSLVYSAIKYVVLVILICWLILETLFVAPYFLSYFNEFAGGTWNGYHFVTDSNYDWGQDLLRLQSFVGGSTNLKAQRSHCSPAKRAMHRTRIRG